MDLGTRTIQKTTARHELSASVDYIEKYIGFSGKYKYNYWLGMVHRSGKTNYQIRQLVDEAMTFDRKYSRGGWLTNKLK